MKKLSLLSAALLATSLLVSPAFAGAQPGWTPKSSERLVKLPATYLKKTLDHDFSQSELGTALQNTEEEGSLKARTLGDLQGAIERADGELQVELRHQFLAEKRSYLDLMSRKNQMRRQHRCQRVRLLDV